MKIAAHTLACPELGLREALVLFAELGFDSVEILVDNDYPCAIPPRATDVDVTALRRHLDALGLTCTHVTPYVRELDHLDEGRRRTSISAIEDAMRIAHRLGAGGVRILAGRRMGEAPDEREEQFVRSMRELSPAAIDRGISLNIETKGWSFAHDGLSTLDLLRAIDSPAVGILLDPANQVMDDGNPTQGLEEQVPFVRHVHFKDAVGASAGDGADYASLSLRPAGEGAVPWRTILRALERGAYAGHIAIEYERRWHPSALPPARVGLAVELQRLREMMRDAHDRVQSDGAKA